MRSLSESTFGDLDLKTFPNKVFEKLKRSEKLLRLKNPHNPHNSYKMLPVKIAGEVIPATILNKKIPTATAHATKKKPEEKNGGKSKFLTKQVDIGGGGC